MIPVGFMQGRLSPRVNGKIQAFPAEHWESEFVAGGGAGFGLIEWTLDQEGLHDNPLLRESGREKILRLSRATKVRVASVTGDCFMQAPFWKAAGVERKVLQDDLLAVLAAAETLDIKLIVIPLVDNGSIDTPAQQQSLLDVLLPLSGWLAERSMAIVFESDLPAKALCEFIAMFPAAAFGINYDIGNSAALGFDPAEEIRSYGARILNVHVKDRPIGGTTVPLGEGAAQFESVFAELAAARYRGNYILQTARAKDDEHLLAAVRYRDMVCAWVKAAEAGR